MTAPDLSTPEAIAQARTEAARLLQRVTPGEWHYRPNRFDDWGMVRAENGHLVALARDGGLSDDRGVETHRANGTDPYEANARVITASTTTTATLVAALDALATTRQALARAEAERERLRRDVLEFIRLSTPNGGYDYWAAVRQRLLHVLDPEEGD